MFHLIGDGLFLANVAARRCENNVSFRVHREMCRANEINRDDLRSAAGLEDEIILELAARTVKRQVNSRVNLGIVARYQSSQSKDASFAGHCPQSSSSAQGADQLR